MTEDRLKILLAEATDLPPSAALRGRIADLRPRPRVNWFALSGATAALIAVVLLAVPREVSAAELLKRAGAESQGRSFRFRLTNLIGGVWRETRRGISAPGWTRYETPEGELDLATPTAHYARLSWGAPVLRRPAEKRSFVDDLRLDRHLEFLRSVGYRPILRKADSRVEDGRTVQDVTIEYGGRDERETITLDAETDLPIRMTMETRRRDGWRPRSRAEYDYPQLSADRAEFWAGIDPKAAVDRASLAHEWERRLSSVLRTLRLSNGSILRVRDLCALPNGDVLLVCSGPRGMNARLSGTDGTAYVRVGSPLNDSHRVSSEMPDLVLNGEALRVFWFAPAQPGARGSTHVRLDILGGPPTPYEREEGPPSPTPEGTVAAVSDGSPPVEPIYDGAGTFVLTPREERASVPAWTYAMPYGSYLVQGDRWRDDARLIAAYDGWLDASNHPIAGTYRLQPVNGEWSGEPPRRGLRRDPAAARAAAAAFRTMTTNNRAHGLETGADDDERWFGRFEREAKGG